MEDSEDDRKPSAMENDLEMARSESPPRQVKPALKKASPGSSSGKPKKALVWDEVAIEEHDKLRGTRMKIDEPDTPYTHYDSGQDSDASESRRPKSPMTQKNALSWDNLQNRLDSVAAVRDAYPSSPSSHAEGEHSDVEDDDRKKEMRKLEFKEHRKRHYNEMELVKKFREEHPEGVTLNQDGPNGDADGDADDEHDD